MYKNFNITEKEKQQIMEMHESNGYKKPLNEEMKLTPDANAVKAVNDIMNLVKSGFCVPTYREGSRVLIGCKDKTRYEIQGYRPFGQDPKPLN